MFDSELWHRIMAINATGAFYGIKHAVPAMTKAGGGAIVNMSSISGVVGQKQIHPAYNASKGAGRILTKDVAVRQAARADGQRVGTGCGSTGRYWGWLDP